MYGIMIVNIRYEVLSVLFSQTNHAICLNDTKNNNENNETASDGEQTCALPSSLALKVKGQQSKVRGQGQICASLLFL